MKQFVLSLLFILPLTYTFAQSKSQLKGPGYKNYKSKKVSKCNKSKVKIYAVSRYQLKGPKAKNYKTNKSSALKYYYPVVNQRKIGKHKKLNVGTTYRRTRKK